MSVITAENAVKRKPMVIIVEDDFDMAQLNSRLLKRHGCDTLTAHSAAEARTLAEKCKPDLFIIDIGLPDGDGLCLCEEFQLATGAQVLFLSGRSETSDKIAGLDAGGDYYLTKPFDKDEFIAVVQNLLRKAKRAQEMAAVLSEINRGSLTLKLIERKAYVNGRDAGLSPKEFAVLQLLVQNEDQEISSEKIYGDVWDAPMNNNSGAVRVHISNLKKKLDEGNAADFSIFSEHGKGYTFSTII